MNKIYCNFYIFAAFLKLVCICILITFFCFMRININNTIIKIV